MVAGHPLTTTERLAINNETDGRCHICAGLVGENWQADHVLCHSDGGLHSVENYLASHALCNNYRWDYSPEEFQLDFEDRRVGTHPDDEQEFTLWFRAGRTLFPVRG